MIEKLEEIDSKAYLLQHLPIYKKTITIQL
jgi:hypothetical protein